MKTLNSLITTMVIWLIENAIFTRFKLFEGVALIFIIYLIYLTLSSSPRITVLSAGIFGILLDSVSPFRFGINIIICISYIIILQYTYYRFSQWKIGWAIAMMVVGVVLVDLPYLFWGSPILYFMADILDTLVIGTVFFVLFQKRIFPVEKQILY